ncbi:MAG: hypothetical protein ACKO26_05385, partial [Planctomycetota bacterium]
MKKSGSQVGTHSPRDQMEILFFGLVEVDHDRFISHRDFGELQEGGIRLLEVQQWTRTGPGLVLVSGKERFCHIERRPLAALDDPTIKAVRNDIIVELKIITRAHCPDSTAISAMDQAIPHAASLASAPVGGPVNDCHFAPVENTVIKHDAMTVGKDWQVIRRRVLVAQEEALGNQQVIKIATLPHDGIVAADRSWLRVFVDRTSQ